MHAHIVVILMPLMWLLLVAAGMGVGVALIPIRYRPEGQYAVVIAGILMIVAFSIIPILRWALTTYTLTTKRLISSWGLIPRRTAVLPINRIDRISLRRGLLQTLAATGTLTLTTASGQTVTLANLPKASAFYAALNELADEEPPMVYELEEPWQ